MFTPAEISTNYTSSAAWHKIVELMIYPEELVAHFVRWRAVALVKQR